MSVSCPSKLSEANELLLSEKFRTFLVASYAYYIRHTTLIPDAVYDFICSCLWHSWDKLDDCAKALVDRGSLEAGTYFNKRDEDYPEWVEVEVMKRMDKRDE